MEHIEDLAQRVEDQEDHIQKLEQSLNSLGNLVQTRLLPAIIQQSAPPKPTHTEEKQRTARPARVRSSRPPRVRHHVPPVQVNPPPQPPRVQFTEIEEPEDEQSLEDVEEEEDSDLDAEIAQELEELDDKEESQGHLKKG